ncbi:hypothetical protein CC1G_10432 [Coprinopsis cinerea okayama7|uniref:F-box domain-containing protein n=1 Tax=Coprinopsis cinerea (strain Okayama-7 / 130 / ATCC MYA-4618 / FGSC 9003) TaxID=240176 RepID=A8PDR2_COPC7|nr:hypothetical protein CC1G_10432 [Coprinopsis cinerea okayama7\|eukprot:XP_001840646.2 hypothetical protein CC1G_10432 [Coprinopsis cinerea okayama7\
MFPLELLEVTIECLAAQGTLEDLHQCTLVNKKLAQLCQKRIFNTVALVQRETRWHIPAEQRVPLPPHPIERFADVVKQNPAIGTYVWELEIQSMLDYNVDDGFKFFGHLHQVHTFTLVFADGPRHVGDPKPWHTISPGLRNSLFSFVRQNPIASLNLYHLSDLPHTFLQQFGHLQKLTVLGVHPDISVCPAIGECYMNSHTIDISEISVLKVDFGIHDEDHVVCRVLRFPVQLETLGLHLRKDFSEWTCRGNILSRLPSPSLNTLRRIDLMINTLNTPELPPYAEFAHELSRIQGQFDSDLNLDPIRWKELGDILASGFPYLRTLTLRAEVSIFDSPSPFEEAAHKQARIKHRHGIELTTSAECMVI